MRGRSPEARRNLPLASAARFHATDRSTGMARKGDADLRKWRPGGLPPLHEIADDTPLRLNVAAALAYPDGSMTASGLRCEAARGRLAIERTAGKDYTTLGSIEEMRDLCRLEARGRDCGSGERAATERP